MAAKKTMKPKPKAKPAPGKKATPRKKQFQPAIQPKKAY